MLQNKYIEIRQVYTDIFTLLAGLGFVISIYLKIHCPQNEAASSRDREGAYDIFFSMNAPIMVQLEGQTDPLEVN
jgi:hypothetical protein